MLNSKDKYEKRKNVCLPEASSFSTGQKIITTQFGKCYEKDVQRVL